MLIDPPPKAPKSPDDAKTATLRIGTTKGQDPAVVLIDGARIGLTPVMAAKVVPGRHTVRWEWADGSSSEVVIELDAGEVKTLKAPPPSPAP